MKVGKSAEAYQVGAHFKALIKAILVAPSRTLEKFFSFRVSLPRCARKTPLLKVLFPTLDPCHFGTITAISCEPTNEIFHCIRMYLYVFVLEDLFSMGGCICDVKF